MAATCTPEMAAQCSMHGATAAAMKGDGCASKGAAAVTADAKGGCPYLNASGECSMHGAKSAQAGTGECSMHGAKGMKATAASAGADCCAGKGVKASAAATGECSMHSTKGVNATAASAGADCCAGKGVKATSAAMNGCSSAKGTSAAAAGAACGSHGTSATSAAMDCDACSDMAACASDIAEAGGRMQIVPLKNGLMYVYTAENSAKIRAVQAAVSRHAERLQAMNAGAEKAHLCPSCRELRGAAASGKLSREVVNIEAGCLTLVTSSDPRLVTRLYAMAGMPSGPRAAKS